MQKAHQDPHNQTVEENKNKDKTLKRPEKQGQGLHCKENEWQKLLIQNTIN